MGRKKYTYFSSHSDDEFKFGGEIFLLWARRSNSAASLNGLTPVLPGDPGAAPGTAPGTTPGTLVFLWRRELKKLANTPSPAAVAPVPLGSNFLFGDETCLW